MDELIIIGSGVAGITCARILAGAGVAFDHRTQYLRPRDPAFGHFLAQAGARPWPDGPDHGRQVGTPGMSGVTRAQADGLTVTQQTEVTAIAWRNGVWHLSTRTGAVQASRVILTIPALQVTALLGDMHPFAADLARVEMEPCLTLMTAFPPDSPRPFASRLDPSHPLAWIAQDSMKPGRLQTAVTWVAQASAAFSREQLEASPDDIDARMLPLLTGVLDVDPALAPSARAHSWRSAQASTPLGQAFLRSSDRTLYAGGDRCLGPRAEDACRSGRAIARDILVGADVD